MAGIPFFRLIYRFYSLQFSKKTHIIFLAISYNIFYKNLDIAFRRKDEDMKKFAVIGSGYNESRYNLNNWIKNTLIICFYHVASCNNSN